MKKIIYLILSCLILTGCEMEMSDNGLLEGNWQFRQIDTLATGGSCDMSKSYIYWAFQTDMLQLRDIDNHNQKIQCRFDRKGDEFTIRSPHLVNTKDDVDLLEDATLLAPYGLTALEEHFTIDHISNEHLTLSNEKYRLHFRKY